MSYRRHRGGRQSRRIAGDRGLLAGFATIVAAATVATPATAGLAALDFGADGFAVAENRRLDRVDGGRDLLVRRARWAGARFPCFPRHPRFAWLTWFTRRLPFARLALFTRRPGLPLRLSFARRRSFPTLVGGGLRGAPRGLRRRLAVAGALALAIAALVPASVAILAFAAALAAATVTSFAAALAAAAIVAPRRVHRAHRGAPRAVRAIRRAWGRRCWGPAMRAPGCR